MGNADTHLDPVCGMSVDPAHAAGSYNYAGKTYYFCSPRCLERFQREPENFLAARPHPTSMPAMPLPARASSAATALEYTCPMHPEVVRDRPGACPICGMALEARVPTLDESPNPELVDMTRRFWLAVLLGAPVLLAAMADMILPGGLSRFVGGSAINWLGLGLAAPVVLWAGWPFFVRAWASIVNRSPNMFTLIAMGVGTAFVYSLLGTFAPGLFPEGFRRRGSVDTYFDTAVVITALVLLVQVLELRARSRTGAALKELLRLAPRSARVVREGD